MPTRIYFNPTRIYFVLSPIYFVPSPIYFVPPRMYFVPTRIYFVPTQIYFVLSRIYFKSAYQLLRIEDEFQGVCSRMMVSRTALSQLKDENGNATDTFDITRINQILTDAYQGDIQEGSLTAHDIHQMSRYMMTQMDLSRDGEVNIAEFVQATTSNETVRAQDMVQFFEENRKKCCLERIFDDTTIHKTVKDYDPEYIVSRGRTVRLSKVDSGVLASSKKEGIPLELKEVGKRRSVTSDFDWATPRSFESAEDYVFLTPG